MTRAEEDRIVTRVLVKIGLHINRTKTREKKSPSKKKQLLKAQLSKSSPQ